MALVPQLVSTTHTSCGNTPKIVDGQRKSCDRSAQGSCPRCNLVQYCSVQCMQEHRPHHKGDCEYPYMLLDYQPPWVRDNRIPTWLLSQDDEFYNRPVDLWANLPAIDILNLQDNELKMNSSDLQESLNLLFPSSGDLNDIFRTLSAIPRRYNGQINVFINDIHYHITYRNIILLIIAFTFDAEAAVPLILHLWYSAFLPSSMIKALRERIIPQLDYICELNASKSEGIFHGASWRCQGSTLIIGLRKKEWYELRRLLTPAPASLSLAAAQRIRLKVVNDQGRQDHIERTYYEQTSAMRASRKKFRQRGVLLPYGVSTEGFDTPNPTLFWLENFWPLGEGADPLDGWAYGDYRKTEFVMQAGNDLYGSLYSMLKTVVGQVCSRLRTQAITFRVTKFEPRRLPTELMIFKPGGWRFDRIDASNLMEHPYYGPQAVIELFAPLLKPLEENAKATLLAHFKTAVTKMQAKHNALHLRELQKVDKDKVSKFIDMYSDKFREATRPENRSTNPMALHYKHTVHRMVDFDKFFDLYVEEQGLKELAMNKRLEIKTENTIVAKWPYRVKDEMDREMFATVCSANTEGYERYLEFQRAAL